MSKKKSSEKVTVNVEANVEKAINAIVEEVVSVVENVEANTVKQLGRPINVNSVRQQRINEMTAKREAGLLKKGRPTIATSKRQATLAERAVKIAEFGSLKQGRPINVNSKRQQTLTEKAMEIAKSMIAEMSVEK